MAVSLVRYQPFTELKRAVDELFDERFLLPIDSSPPTGVRLIPLMCIRPRTRW